MLSKAKIVALLAVLLVGVGLGVMLFNAQPSGQAAAMRGYSLCHDGEDIVLNFNAPQTGPGSAGFPDDDRGTLEPFLGKDMVSLCWNEATSKLRLSAAENGLVKVNFMPTGQNKFRYAITYSNRNDTEISATALCFSHNDVKYKLYVYALADMGARFSIINDDGSHREFFAPYDDSGVWKGKQYSRLSELNFEYVLPDGTTARNRQDLHEMFLRPEVRANISDYAFSESGVDYEIAVCAPDTW